MVVVEGELAEELARVVELLDEEVADPGVVPAFRAVEDVEVVVGAEGDVGEFGELALAAARAADLDVGAFAGPGAAGEGGRENEEGKGEKGTAAREHRALLRSIYPGGGTEAYRQSAV